MMYAVVYNKYIDTYIACTASEAHLNFDIEVIEDQYPTFSEAFQAAKRMNEYR